MIISFRSQGVLLFVGLLFCSALAIAQTATPAPDLKTDPADVSGYINPALPTLFVAGDSTAAKGEGDAQQGWGEPFKTYFAADAR